LLEEGAVIKTCDPTAVNNFSRLLPQIHYTAREGVLDFDAVIIVTECKEFSSPDYEGKIVIDGRMVLKAREAGIYKGVCW